MSDIKTNTHIISDHTLQQIIKDAVIYGAKYPLLCKSADDRREVIDLARDKARVTIREAEIRQDHE